MPSRRNLSGTQGSNERILHTGLLMKLRGALSYTFTGITALALFIPLNPRMPSSGIDASWELAMNEAVARHMSFGEQILFTYGPYASICTRHFHPATDARMVWGSLLLGVSYLSALLLLARGGKRWTMLILLLFLITYGSPETLLLSYPFVLAVCILKVENSDDFGGVTALSRWQVAGAVVMLFALGLLPLIKGSLLLPYTAAVAITSAFLFYRSITTLAVLFLFVPAAATAAFWALAGQSFANLPAFLRGTTLLASGYTEAMSTPWTILPRLIGDGLVILSLAVTASVFVSVGRSVELKAASKWMLLLVFAVFQFVAFKHGIVKVEGLSSIFSSLAVFILIIAFIHLDRCLVWSLVTVMALTAVTSVQEDPVLKAEVHERFGAGVTWSGESRPDIFMFCLERATGAYSRTIFNSAWKRYLEMWEGVRARMGVDDSLNDRFNRAMETIRNNYPLPALRGSGDVYTSEESVLLASANEWNPRPVFQSYTAYTPVLLRLNEQHLRGKNSPDWVLLDLQTIDGRLPSLDDGASWPALFDNYSFVSYDGRYVLLRRGPVVYTQSNYTGTYKEICKIGQAIVLPKADGLQFAEVDLKPTLFGRLLTAIFSPPQLRIVLHLADGSTRYHRVVGNMMETGFLLSPFVGNTKDFAALFETNRGFDRGKRVESISIAPTYGGTLFWANTYELTLRNYIRKRDFADEIAPGE